MDKTDAILQRDTIAETEEKFGGKHWSKFNDIENLLMMGNAMRDNQGKAEHLKAIGDTYWGVSWQEFLTLLTKHGFIQALKYDINHGDDVDEAIVYYHPQKGLVIWATSFYNKTVINSGNLYGEIKANSKEDCKAVWRNISTGGCIDKEEMIYSTKQDVREGLFHKISSLESAGTFLLKWSKKNRFLWFVDYVEDDEPGYDYKTITAAKIDRCPQELRSIVGRL